MTTATTRGIPALARRTASIGLGCMGMSWAYTATSGRDDEAAVQVIRGALDRGIGLLDTSDVYGLGHNEELVGRAIAGRREEAIIATKCGLVGAYDEDGQPSLSRDARPQRLRQACHESLRRLGVDSIDLYYLHRIDPRVPLEDSWSALADLVERGDVRALGLSEVTVEQAAAAHAIHRVAAVQSELSLWTRDPLGEGTNADGEPSGDLVAWTAAHGAVFVGFSPLGRGFLSGTVASAHLSACDYRARLPRFTGEAERRNQRIVDVVRRVATRHEVPAAVVALAWVLARGEHVIPIPGTTNLAHLDSNLAAAELRLSAADLAELDAVPPAVGSRY